MVQPEKIISTILVDYSIFISYGYVLEENSHVYTIGYLAPKLERSLVFKQLSCKFC